MATHRLSSAFAGSAGGVSSLSAFSGIASGWNANNINGDTGTVNQTGGAQSGLQAAIGVLGMLADDGVIPSTAIVNSITISYDWALTMDAGKTWRFLAFTSSSTADSVTQDETVSASGTFTSTAISGGGATWGDLVAGGHYPASDSIGWYMQEHVSDGVSNNVRLVVSNFGVTVDYTPAVEPNLASVSPSTGDCAGGITVTITGSGFGFATGVRFGDTAAIWTLIDDTTIAATVPAHAAGAVTVAVAGVGSLVDGFTYTYTLPVTLTVQDTAGKLPPLPVPAPISGGGGILGSEWVRWLTILKQRIENLIPAAGLSAELAIQGSPVVPWGSVLKASSSLADLEDRNAGDLAIGTLPDGRLSNTGVSAGTYGDATHVSRVTVDAKGRVTAASSVAFTAGPSAAKIAARVSLRVL